MTRKRITDMTERELDALTNEEFLRVARGQDLGPARKRTDLASTPEREEALILSRLLQQSGMTADLSGDPIGRVLTDEELLRGKRELLDGTQARRLVQRRAIEQQAERLGWSLRAYRAGEVIPSDDAEQLRELGMLG